MSSADNEPSFAAKQRTFQRKLGRCLMRLQQVELLVKSLWIDSEHEYAFGQIEEAQAAQAKRKDVVGDKTLGTARKIGSFPRLLDRLFTIRCDSLQRTFHG